MKNQYEYHDLSSNIEKQTFKLESFRVNQHKNQLPKISQLSSVVFGEQEHPTRFDEQKHQQNQQQALENKIKRTKQTQLLSLIESKLIRQSSKLLDLSSPSSDILDYPQKKKGRKRKKKKNLSCYQVPLTQHIASLSSRTRGSSLEQRTKDSFQIIFKDVKKKLSQIQPKIDEISPSYEYSSYQLPMNFPPYLFNHQETLIDKPTAREKKINTQTSTVSASSKKNSLATNPNETEQSISKLNQHTGASSANLSDIEKMHISGINNFKVSKRNKKKLSEESDYSVENNGFQMLSQDSGQLKSIEKVKIKSKQPLFTSIFQRKPFTEAMLLIQDSDTQEISAAQNKIELPYFLNNKDAIHHHKDSIEQLSSLRKKSITNHAISCRNNQEYFERLQTRRNNFQSLSLQASPKSIHQSPHYRESRRESNRYASLNHSNQLSPTISQRRGIENKLTDIVNSNIKNSFGSIQLDIQRKKKKKEEEKDKQELQGLEQYLKRNSIPYSPVKSSKNASDLTIQDLSGRKMNQMNMHKLTFTKLQPWEQKDKRSNCLSLNELNTSSINLTQRTNTEEQILYEFDINEYSNVKK